MKYGLMIMIVLGLGLQADYVKKTIAVCSNESAVEDLRKHSKDHLVEKGGLELELWLMNHDCKIIDKKTKITVLDYNGKKEYLLKVKLDKTGEVVYTLNKGIQVEQPGQKNVIFKF